MALAFEETPTTLIIKKYRPAGHKIGASLLLAIVMLAAAGTYFYLVANTFTLTCVRQPDRRPDCEVVRRLLGAQVSVRYVEGVRSASLAIEARRSRSGRESFNPNTYPLLVLHGANGLTAFNALPERPIRIWKTPIEAFLADPAATSIFHELPPDARWVAGGWAFLLLLPLFIYRIARKRPHIVTLDAAAAQLSIEDSKARRGATSSADIRRVNGVQMLDRGGLRTVLLLRENQAPVTLFEFHKEMDTPNPAQAASEVARRIEDWLDGHKARFRALGPASGAAEDSSLRRQPD